MYHGTSRDCTEYTCLMYSPRWDRATREIPRVLKKDTMSSANPGRVAKLSDPSLRWMAALYDARSCMEEPAVPSETQLSRKFKVFGRGSFATGTTGYGFILVSPPSMAANNAQFASCTAANSVGGAVTNPTGFTNVVNLGATNSDYPSAAYGAGIGLLSWKLVGCTVYVKYAGTELNRGGDMILVEDPSHGSLTAQSYNTCMSLDFTKRVSVINEWQSVSWTPADSLETDFSFVSPVNTNFPLGLYVNSAGASQPFDYEVYAWFEVVGSSARGATISFNDPVGFGAVSGAMNQFQQLDSVLGMHGFVAAVEEQLSNMSGCAMTTTHQQNWAGLAAFLPSLANVASRALSGAVKGVAKEYGYEKVGKKPTVPVTAPTPKTAAAKVLVRKLMTKRP